jgi:hypothetical protein
MKKLMMKYLMVSCREATFMMAKRDEGRLGLADRVKLLIHTSMCSVCKKFDRQVGEIARQGPHLETDAGMPDETKNRLGNMLDQHM